MVSTVVNPPQPQPSLHHPQPQKTHTTHKYTKIHNTYSQTQKYQPYHYEAKQNEKTEYKHTYISQHFFLWNWIKCKNIADLHEKNQEKRFEPVWIENKRRCRLWSQHSQYTINDSFQYTFLQLTISVCLVNLQIIFLSLYKILCLIGFHSIF